MPKNETSLFDVIADCGGPTKVAGALGKARQSIWEWIRNGHLPLSELKGRTRYSDELAQMQRSGGLTADDIRKIGFDI